MKKTVRAPLVMLVRLLASTTCVALATPASASPSMGSATPVRSIDAGFDSPENAYYDATSKTLFVSNVAGGPMDKNGKGWIARVSLDGKVVDPRFVDGLNSPKGLLVHAGTLWITAVDELIGVPLSNPQRRVRIAVPGALCLNSVAFDSDEVMYASDTCGDRIFQVKGSKASVFLDAPLGSPNGILVHGTRLYVTGSDLHVNGKMDIEHSHKQGNLYAVDLRSRKREPITHQPVGMLDGLDIDSRGNFIVSDWSAGRVYRVAPNGAVTLLIDVPGEHLADVSLVRDQNLLAVAVMSRNLVYLYRYPSPGR